MPSQDCSGCEHVGNCSVLGLFGGCIRFPTAFLDRGISEVISDPKQVRLITALIGPFFGKTNLSLEEAIKSGLLTCKGELTSKGYKEAEERISSRPTVASPAKSKPQLKPKNGVVNLDDVRKSSSKK